VSWWWDSFWKTFCLKFSGVVWFVITFFYRFLHVDNGQYFHLEMCDWFKFFTKVNALLNLLANWKDCARYDWLKIFDWILAWPHWDWEYCWCIHSFDQIWEFVRRSCQGLPKGGIQMIRRVFYVYLWVEWFLRWFPIIFGQNWGRFENFRWFIDHW
jgi:hypothetical protein